MDFGYARVSTAHQDLDRQLRDLRAHGIPDARIYQDKKTGATFSRVGFTDLLGHARAGDTIVATNLDRLGRNLRECLNIVHDLREQGIGIRTLKDPIPIDTSDDSMMADMAVALLALFAHMERVFMLERAANARAAAAAKGKLPGRPPKLTPAKLATARAAIAAGQSVDDVAPTIGISRATLYRHLAVDTRTLAPRVPMRVQVTGSRFKSSVPAGARYVGRPAPGLKGSPYANTHRIGHCKRCGTEHDQAAAVIAYTRDLANDPDLLDRARAELAGQDLACWCSPSGEDITCHGDVLVRVVAGQDPADLLETLT